MACGLLKMQDIDNKQLKAKVNPSVGGIEEIARTRTRRWKQRPLVLVVGFIIIVPTVAPGPIEGRIDHIVPHDLFHMGVAKQNIALELVPVGGQLPLASVLRTRIGRIQVSLPSPAQVGFSVCNTNHLCRGHHACGLDVIWPP